MHLANQGLFIQIATTLWALSIKPSGHVPSKMDFVDAGVTVKPAPFECTFVERSSDTTLGRQLLAGGAEGR
ncbi:hypothetical protein CYLTODRAFT_74823 [Cylindrobasidium torrendii FP15055 ss-10]|uniref:Uncharacterized protein n=1 Tax=Cylindrobasidium torrendii FP15055 ss-10 TaxID=1314674 RepID=A0A0D7B3H2_9AGAR|nr:hypothetical protein CYLTODRAFT_74823 [Cylindrobasidium torrendii FP15055 ss-10]